jgi:hypothetical protein
MKPTIRDRLHQATSRHEEIGLLLSQPEVFSDQNRFRELSMEFAQLGPVVQSWQKWQATRNAIDDARLLLNESARGREVWFVGDNDVDMACARAAGCFAVLVGAAEDYSGDTPMTITTYFWKSGPAAAVTRPPFLPAMCSGCTRNMPKIAAGHWKS